MEQSSSEESIHIVARGNFSILYQRNIKFLHILKQCFSFFKFLKVAILSYTWWQAGTGQIFL